MRCYDGCPDDELQALIDDEVKASKELARHGMRATYFPMEGKYMVFQGLKPITGFHSSRRSCVREVFRTNEIRS